MDVWTSCNYSKFLLKHIVSLFGLFGASHGMLRYDELQRLILRHAGHLSHFTD